MNGHDIASRWLADSAVGGLIVLLAGSLAARFCRQPVRRARVVVVTLVAAFAVPWIGALPIVPRWSLGLVTRNSPAQLTGMRDSGELRGSAAAAALPGVLGKLPPEPRRVGLGADRTRPREPIEVTRGAALGGQREARPWLAWPGARALSEMAKIAYVAIAVGLGARWLLGHLLLWRVHRAARPVSPQIREVFGEIAGAAGQKVILLESDRVPLPFTYTWAQSVIVLPRPLCAARNSQELRFALAHEWSHIERRDALAWNFAALAGLVLFYQPLFWWLRRQLRLCQDYLADDRAAAIASAEDYASYLVGLARSRPTVPALPALSVGDRRSNLFRRVKMLVQDHEPLEHQCRALWTTAAAVSAALLMVVASGLRLDAAAPSDDKPAASETKRDDTTPPIEGARTWKGRVTAKGTGKPIAGADVVVEISVSRDPTTKEPKTLREVHHTTGSDGAYEFTISPAEAAERLLYITLIVKDRDHVEYFGGYSYGMIQKNEKLGERPFFENLELWPGKAIEGLVQTPEGAPAAGVKVQAFTSPDPSQAFPDGRWAESKTDALGRFRLVLHKKGQAVFWILPQDYAPETHVLKNDHRGDLGKFVLSPGIRFGGRVLDVTGKPVAGVYVEADLQNEGENDDNAVPSGIADMKHRATLTAADGSFAFRPLPPGEYRVYPSEQGWDPSTREGAHDPHRRPLPGVFTPQMTKLKPGKPTEPLEIRAVPHVVVEAQVFNSKGQKRSSHEINLVGQIDGRFWSASCEPTALGAYRMFAPHGLEEAQITLMTNEHSALQFRTSKGAPLEHSRQIRLGTLDHDVTGIEIIRYEAPIIIISAATKDGKPVKDFKASVDFTEPGERRDGKYILKGGMHSDVSLEDHGEGRYRTSQLVPDREVVVTIKADGFAPASRKLKLPEGKTEEVTLVLETE